MPGAHESVESRKDLVLPGADGIELMEQVEELADLPVIFISAYGRDEIVARALDAGAADYIVKPFSPTELTARVRAALRGRAEPEPFVPGELVVRYEQRRGTVAGRPVELTPIEFELLRVLSLNAGRMLTYHALGRQAWGERDRRGSSADRKVVTAVVRRLRQELAAADAAGPAYILNERGVGYRMPDRDRAGDVGQDVDPTLDAPVSPPGRLCVRLDIGAGDGSGPAGGLRLAVGGRGRGELEGHDVGGVARVPEGCGQLVDVGRLTSGPARHHRG